MCVVCLYGIAYDQLPEALNGDTPPNFRRAFRIPIVYRLHHLFLLPMSKKKKAACEADLRFSIYRFDPELIDLSIGWHVFVLIASRAIDE